MWKENIESPLSNLENFCLYAVGKLVCAGGIVGFIITLFFDCIARGMPFMQSEFDWLQILGIVIFALTIALGIVTDRFLNGTIRKIVNEWASK